MKSRSMRSLELVSRFIRIAAAGESGKTTNRFHKNCILFTCLKRIYTYYFSDMQSKSLVLILSALSSTCVVSFSISYRTFRGKSHILTKSTISLASDKTATEESANSDVLQETPIECYLVNEDEVVEEGAAPKVVCTSDPDEYAWMEGLDRNQMQPTDGVENMTGQCVEGASPTGKPEWECKE